MSLRARKGRWEYRFQVGGVPVSKLTDLEATESNRGAALRLEQQALAELVRTKDRPKRRQASMPFRRALGLFIEYQQSTRLESTVKRKIGSSRSLQDYFGGMSLSQVSEDSIVAYMNHRRRIGIKANSLANDVTTLKEFLRWCCRRKMIAENPAEHVGTPARVSGRYYVVKEDEQAAYFAAAIDVSRDLYDFGRLMLLQGPRNEELLNLRQSDVDFVAGTIRIQKSKTNAGQRILKMREESREILFRRCDGKSEWVFPSPRRPGRPITKLNNPHNEVCEKIGIYFRLYDWRHTFATQFMRRRAGSLVDLQATLGHSSLRMVLCYAHASQDGHDEAMIRLDAHPERNAWKS